MRKNEGYKALFDLIRADISKAYAIAKEIPNKKFEAGLLLPYLSSPIEQERDLAKTLLHRVLPLNLDCDDLIDFIREAKDNAFESFIITLGRKISPSRLVQATLCEYELNEHRGLSNFAMTLLIQNFITEMDYPVLIRAQKLDDEQLRIFAYTEALKFTGDDLDFEVLVKFQRSDCEEVRELADKLVRKLPASKMSFSELMKIVDIDSNPYVRATVIGLLIRNFDRKLSCDDLLKMCSKYMDSESTALAQETMMENYGGLISLDYVIRLQKSKFEKIRNKSWNLALLCPVELLDFENLIYLLEGDSCTPEEKRLTETLLLRIPTPYLSYETMIMKQRSGNKDVREITRSIAFKFRALIFDPTILAKYMESQSDEVRRLATELMLKIPIDYQKEAKDFVKKYFSD